MECIVGVPNSFLGHPIVLLLRFYFKEGLNLEDPPIHLYFHVYLGRTPKFRGLSR